MENDFGMTDMSSFEGISMDGHPTAPEVVVEVTRLA